MSKICVICASNNNNLKLAKRITEQLKQKKYDVDLMDLVDAEIPLFTPAIQEQSGVPEQVQQFVESFKQCDRMVFVAPEYNGGVPPALSNLIAWVSVSGDDWRECFNHKSALLATHSGGGGAKLMASLRLSLSHIGMNILGREIITSYSKDVKEENLEKVLDLFTSFN